MRALEVPSLLSECLSCYCTHPAYAGPMVPDQVVDTSPRVEAGSDRLLQAQHQIDGHLISELLCQLLLCVKLCNASGLLEIL